MTEAIKLTVKQWKLVQSQCIYCRFWNAEEGCGFPGSCSREPAEDCGVSEDKKVYICPETCIFFFGEDGCISKLPDQAAQYEKDGDYPLCPHFTKRVSQKGVNNDSREDSRDKSTEHKTVAG